MTGLTSAPNRWVPHSLKEPGAGDPAAGDPAAVTLTYAHCSCRATGRDGVAADAVVVRRGGAAKPRPLEGADAVAARYATRFRGVGRPTRTL